jgi:hypothetical protein
MICRRNTVVNANKPVWKQSKLKEKNKTEEYSEKEFVK